MSGVMSRVSLNTSHVDTQVQDGKCVYNFNKKKHAQVLLHNLVSMQDNLSDVIITSKENEQFHFHGPILAALSKKLEDTVERVLGSAASKGSKIVMEENFSSEAVQCLWDYAYTSIVTLTPSNIEEVKRLAERHGLDNLMEECNALERKGFGEDKVQVEFQNLPENILNRLHDLWIQHKQCSIVFKLLDEMVAKFSFHDALVAAACSDVLTTLAQKDRNNQLEGNSATFQILALFVEYLYTAKLMIDRATVLPLLQFAVNFNIPSIGNACCCWLEDAITPENALGIMSTARGCKSNIRQVDRQDGVSLYQALTDLYQSARSFALRDFRSIQDSDEYLASSFEELIDLIDDDDLVVKSEEDVFYAVMKWVEFDKQTRAEYLPNLLQIVRLEHMSFEFLDTILYHELTITNSSCIQVVENAQRICIPSRPRRRQMAMEYVYF